MKTYWILFFAYDVKRDRVGLIVTSSIESFEKQNWWIFNNVTFETSFVLFYVCFKVFLLQFPNVLYEFIYLQLLKNFHRHYFFQKLNTKPLMCHLHLF